MESAENQKSLQFLVHFDQTNKLLAYKDKLMLMIRKASKVMIEKPKEKKPA